MPPNVLLLNETDVVRLVLPFLERSGLAISAAALERESGVTHACHPAAALGLREMLQRGRWADAVHFLRGLQLTESEMKQALFQITKQKYVELICIYQELQNELLEDLANAIAVCFSELSAYCADSAECENLRRLASMQRLDDDPLYRGWDPFSSRKECFRKVWQVLERDDEGTTEQRLISPDRLLHLVVKGVLYESCEEFCRHKCLTQSNADTEFKFGSLTEGPFYNDQTAHRPTQIRNEFERAEELKREDHAFKKFDCSLYSWLQTLPWVSIAKSFVCRSLDVEVRKLVKPESLRGWTEKILEGASEYPVEDVREKFWNERISSNLIVDAPEILKRAEEVVNRWESKTKMRFKKNIVLEKKENHASSEKALGGGKTAKPPRRKSFFTYCESPNQTLRENRTDAELEKRSPLFCDFREQTNKNSPRLKNDTQSDGTPENRGCGDVYQDADVKDGDIAQQEKRYANGSSSNDDSVGDVDEGIENVDETQSDEQKVILGDDLSKDVKTASDLVHEDFFERKKFVVGLLQTKEQLRENLLQILTRKTPGISGEENSSQREG